MKQTKMYVCTISLFIICGHIGIGGWHAVLVSGMYTGEH